MTETITLEQQFVKRYQEYQKNTQEILKMIPNVIIAIEQTLVDEDYNTLQWEDAQFSTEDGVLVLIGNVKVEVGDDIRLDDGRVVKVTEENVGTLRRLVRVGIPLDLAKTGSVDDVLDYLSDKHHKNYTPLEGEPETIDDLIPEEQVDEYYNKALKQELEEVLGFDTEGLTEDQVEQLLLFNKSRKIH
jgi:hypothetical protein